MPPQTDKATGDQRLFKALSHPLRRRILVALNDQESSPSQLSELLGERLGNVSYHVKILERIGAAELVKTEPVRGAIEHFYRSTIRGHFSWSPLDLDQQGHEELVVLLDQTRERALELQAEAEQRIAAGSEPTHRTELALLNFERTDAGAD